MSWGAKKNYQKGYLIRLWEENCKFSVLANRETHCHWFWEVNLSDLIKTAVPLRLHNCHWALALLKLLCHSWHLCAQTKPAINRQHQVYPADMLASFAPHLCSLLSPITALESPQLLDSTQVQIWRNKDAVSYVLSRLWHNSSWCLLNKGSVSCATIVKTSTYCVVTSQFVPTAVLYPCSSVDLHPVSWVLLYTHTKKVSFPC